MKREKKTKSSNSWRFGTVETAVHHAKTEMDRYEIDLKNEEKSSQANDNETTQTDEKATHQRKYKHEYKDEALLPVYSALWATRDALQTIEARNLGLEHKGIKKYEPEEVWSNMDGKGRVSYPGIQDLCVYPAVLWREN